MLPLARHSRRRCSDRSLRHPQILIALLVGESRRSDATRIKTLGHRFSRGESTSEMMDHSTNTAVQLTKVAASESIRRPTRWRVNDKSEKRAVGYKPGRPTAPTGAYLVPSATALAALALGTGTGPARSIGVLIGALLRALSRGRLLPTLLATWDILGTVLVLFVSLFLVIHCSLLGHGSAGSRNCNRYARSAINQPWLSRMPT